MRKISNDIVADEVTYFYHIQDRQPQDRAEPAQRQKDFNDINTFVQQHGGKCRLFATTGAGPDFISVISGISAASAIKVAAEIERLGAIKVTLVAGLEEFN